jgi:hypothetical protein
LVRLLQCEYLDVRLAVRASDVVTVDPAHPYFVGATANNQIVGRFDAVRGGRVRCTLTGSAYLESA